MTKMMVSGLAAALCLSAMADEASTARRFEQAKRSEPELIAFLKRMPKGGDLHNHVTGAVYSDFLLDNAVARNLFFDPETSGFRSTATDRTVPAADLLRNNTLLYSYLNAVSMRGWTPNTVDGHDHFFDTFDTIGTGMDGMTTEDFLAEVAKRNLAQNVQYMELMTRCAPGETLAPVLNTQVELASLDVALATIAPKLQDLARSIPAYMDAREVNLTKRLALKAPISSPKSPITLRYIYSFSRLITNELFFVNAAAAMTCAKSDPRVVAINIVAPEDHPNSRRNFNEQMRILDFLWNRLGRPKVTLHAGELTLKYSPVEPMRDRIRKSIVLGHASRIGHGVSIAWEEDLGNLFKLMKQRGVMVEVCLSSNASILGVSGTQHPFLLYRKAGIPVCLNTDDEGVSRSNLTNEWVRGARTYNLSYVEMKDLARNAVAYSFLTGMSLYTDRAHRKPRPGFEGVGKPGWRPNTKANAVLAKSEKAQVQLRLEQAFARFESQ